MATIYKIKNKNAEFRVIDQEYVATCLSNSGKHPINETILLLLVHMLEDLKHPYLKNTKQAYGLLDNGTFDQTVKQQYLKEDLYHRMNDKNYTFFVLYQDNEPVALASGNVYQGNADKAQNNIILLNAVTEPAHRQSGYMRDLFVQINNWANERGINKVKILMSGESIQAGNLDLYTTKLANMGIEDYKVIDNNTNSTTKKIIEVPVREIKLVLGVHTKSALNQLTEEKLGHVKN